MQNHLDFGRLRPAIAKLLRGMLGSKARAVGYEIEDFTQDTILRALARQRTSAAWNPTRASWETWIVRVANDTLRTAYRRQKLQAKVEAARDWA